jgi:hypothetical protein
MTVESKGVERAVVPSSTDVYRAADSALWDFVYPHKFDTAFLKAPVIENFFFSISLFTAVRLELVS